jgi:hypothetical protein
MAEETQELLIRGHTRSKFVEPVYSTATLIILVAFAAVVITCTVIDARDFPMCSTLQAVVGKCLALCVIVFWAGATILRCSGCYQRGGECASGIPVSCLAICIYLVGVAGFVAAAVFFVQGVTGPCSEWTRVSTTLVWAVLLPFVFFLCFSFCAMCGFACGSCSDARQTAHPPPHWVYGGLR